MQRLSVPEQSQPNSDFNTSKGDSDLELIKETQEDELPTSTTKQLLGPGQGPQTTKTTTGKKKLNGEVSEFDPNGLLDAIHTSS